VAARRRAEAIAAGDAEDIAILTAGKGSAGISAPLENVTLDMLRARGCYRQDGHRS
jgi:hypothetical protein